MGKLSKINVDQIMEKIRQEVAAKNAVISPTAVPVPDPALSTREERNIFSPPPARSYSLDDFQSHDDSAFTNTFQEGLKHYRIPRKATLERHMSDSEKFALAQLIQRVKPRCSIRVGAHSEDTLSLLSKYSGTVFNIDTDSGIQKKYKKFTNIRFLPGASDAALALLLKDLGKAAIPVDFILIDGDYSAEGIQRNIADLIAYIPQCPLYVMIHDSLNPECRRGILEANWGDASHIHWMDVDFTPGSVVEHQGSGQRELMGGFCLAYFRPEEKLERIVDGGSPGNISHRMKELKTSKKEEQSKVSIRDLIIAAYRAILGREPDSEYVIKAHMTSGSPEEILNNFLSSNEYLSKNNSSRWLCEKLVVETDAAPDKLKLMTSHIQEVWTEFGESEPHWSVMTSEKFKSDRISQTKEEFYSTGKPEVEMLKLFCKRNDINLSRRHQCLEYGCGVGRVTGWLASEFSHVYAYDISQNHIRIAEKYLLDKGIRNVDFITVKTLKDLDRIKKVDVVYSFIVLQHNPPPVIKIILKALLNALNPDGVALFQLPTYRHGYQFLIKDYLRNVKSMNDMEMHVLPHHKVFGIIEDSGCRTLEVIEDNWTGEGYYSNTFFVQKK